MVGVRHDNRKFFTAVTANKVGFAQALFEEQRQAFNDPVAHRVAVTVVHALEMVEVEHRKTQRVIFAARAVGAVFEQLQDMGVVVQSGQAVAHHARF